jgi:lactoylglutathione lyase
MLGPISAIRVFVRDLARARDFYGQTLGLDLNGESPEALLFDGGGCTLIVERCAPGDPEAHDLVGRFTAVSFEAPDIDAAHAALSEKGVAFEGPPAAQAWGGRLAHFRDPDGNVLTLVAYG